jgi:di/tricarboxylate transporter
MSPEAISLLTLVGVVGLFLWNRLPVELVAFGAALTLYFTGVLDLSQALAGLSDPAVVFIAALFIVSEGLDSTGVTAWVGQGLGKFTRGEPRRILVGAMILAAVLTAFIGLNGSIAALLPVVVLLALRNNIATSRLLMPLAFAGSAGGLLLLTGSPVNVVVAEAAQDAGGYLSYFEFALVGLPLAIVSIGLILVLGPRLIPERVSLQVPPDLSSHARTLVKAYDLHNIFHVRVAPESPLVGRRRALGGLDGFPDLRVVTVLNGQTQRPDSEGWLDPGDRLTLVGDGAQAYRFAAQNSLTVERVRASEDVKQSIMSVTTGAAEVVIPPRSRFVGERTHAGMVFLGGSLVVLAIQRQGKDLGPGEVQLQPGDVLLMEGDWPALEETLAARDILVVESPELIRRQSVPRGRGSTAAMAILVAMVIMLATGAVPPAVAALLAAGGMLLTGALTIHQAYRGISWSTVLLIAGMIPLSTAITTSGAGEAVADVLVSAVGERNPLILLLGLALITLVFGQLISNTATVLIMIPVALSAAASTGIPPTTVLMTLCVAGAAAFLTPVATPANMMVMGPGGYRFGDYWRMGGVLFVVFLLAAVLLVPLIWGL